jgi:hypothetical protein
MNKLPKELIGVGVTAARYGIAEWIARRVRDGKSTAIPMAGLVAADILDGVVDQLSVGRVAFEVGKKHPKSRKYIAALALRAVGVGLANGVHLLKTGEVTKGRTKQRAANLSAAAFGVIATTGNETATEIAGTAAVAISVATAPGHFRGVGKRNNGVLREL